MVTVEDRDPQFSPALENAIIEDALQTYPLAEARRNFTADVMTRIRAATPRPRFHLHWIDYAIAFFGLAMAIACSLVWAFTPHNVVAWWKVQLAHSARQIDLQMLILPAVLLALLSLAVLLGAAAVFKQGQRTTR